MSTIFKYIFVVFLLIATFISPPHSQATTYTIDNSIFTNPERGFLHYPGDCGTNIFALTKLQSYRTTENISLIMCNFYLKSFKASPIDQATLNTLESQLSTIRAAGLKVVLRFAYNEVSMESDASLPQILAHIDQLTPILQANRDIIYVWQAGFIGSWGEWYYTSNFGNAGTISTQQWADRKSVVTKMLAALPTSMLSLRTPLFKTTMFGATPLSDAIGFGTSPIAHIGHHNDAFVASGSDMGTYKDITTEQTYLAAETNYVPMGGENNAYAPPRSDCPTALSEMQKLHWSYINTDYLKTTLDAWTAQGCMDTMKRQLGYRFVLDQATYPSSITPGGPIALSATIRNIGYANLYYPRPVFLVLYNATDSYTLPISVDPRTWKSGSTNTINQALTVPVNAVSGTYKMALWLPDESVTNRSNVAYSIRFANTGIWDTTLGYNILDSNIVLSGTIIKIGDATGEGIVDDDDFAIWKNSYLNTPSSTGATKGDFDNNGVVDGIDYMMWANNYGK